MNEDGSDKGPVRGNNELFDQLLGAIPSGGRATLEALSSLVAVTENDSDLRGLAGFAQILIAHHWASLSGELAGKLRSDAKWRTLASSIDWTGLPGGAGETLIPLIGRQ